MLLGRFSDGDLISPATAAILVTPAKDRNTKADAVPRLVMPFLEKRPSCENACASIGFPHSKDGSPAASTVSDKMNRTDIPTIGI